MIELKVSGLKRPHGERGLLSRQIGGHGFCSECLLNGKGGGIGDGGKSDNSQARHFLDLFLR
jgi:hypothetical protein